MSMIWTFSPSMMLAGFQKRLVDGDAAHVMQIGLRDRYAVDLGFDDFNLEFPLSDTDVVD